MMKRIFAFVLSAALCLGLVGCGGSSAGNTSSTPKDYAQIIHDSRAAEFNEYFMTVSPSKEGEGFVGIDGFAADYTEPGQLDSFANDLVLPMLYLTSDMYEDFAASVSLMMGQCYGIVIVKPAEGQTETVVSAMENYIETQRSNLSTYGDGNEAYEIAKSGTVTVADSGEVVLVCCADGDAVLTNILAALVA